MKQISFETTGLLNREPKGARPTGPQRGAIGSEGKQSAAVAKLCSQTPSQTNRNLLDVLRQQFGVTRRVRGMVLVGEPETAFVTDGRDVDWQSAFNAVSLAMLPAPADVLEQELGLVEVLCARGKEDGETAELGLMAFVGRLSKYPADVALKCLRDWPEENKYGPDWETLSKKLKSMAQERRDILASIEWSSQQKPDAMGLPAPRRDIAASFEHAPDLEIKPKPPAMSQSEMAARLRAMGENNVA